jgi:hypothetical protein
MSKSWLLALVVVLPGCSVFSTDCSREKAALRATDSAIAHATRHRDRGFTARLASRGHATYHCAPGPAGQVHCARSATRSAPDTDLNELYRKRDAAVARVGNYCG